MCGQLQHRLDCLFLSTAIAMNRPHEIQAESLTTELELLCRCARIAHKYQFQSIEAWALKVLNQSLVSSPLLRLVMLAEVAVLCGHTRSSQLDKARPASLALQRRQLLTHHQCC
jgi:hypothetical protein